MVVSDQQIVVWSGLLDLLQQGDARMGDKGFDISRLMTKTGIELITQQKKEQKEENNSSTTN